MEDQINRITKKITKLLYNNSELFPIVESIAALCDKLSIEDKDREFYIRHTLETRMGLRTIVRNKYILFDDLRWFLNNETCPIVMTAIIKSICFEYLCKYEIKEDKIKFESLDFTL